MPVKDMTGLRFGRILVLGRATNNKDGSARWHCQCDCGNTTISMGWGLRKGDVQSCGCSPVRQFKSKSAKSEMRGNRPAMRTDLTAEEIRSILSYDPATGLFKWHSTGKGRRLDLRAGIAMKDGYINIVIGGRMYAAHRLAWLYSTGAWPRDQIDHINGIRNDNRLENLREATQAQQGRNAKTPTSNTSGIKGVRFFKGRFVAQITHNGRYYYLGRFDTAEEAARVRSAEAKKLHKEFARD